MAGVGPAPDEVVVDEPGLVVLAFEASVSWEGSSSAVADSLSSVPVSYPLQIQFQRLLDSEGEDLGWVCSFLKKFEVECFLLLF